MPREARQAAYSLGRNAERIAALWLRLKGYRVIARGVRTALGEIDLVVRRGQVLAFVEVKARQELDTAAAAITPRQRGRIVRAAEAFRLKHEGLARLAPRFDAVLLRPGRLPRHVPDAWRP
jgi:putative endonuclease